MTPRTGMSQVKFRVRHNALLLREFTVADMVQATGLNPESVRTELQRMKQERLLISHPHPVKPKRRGGPPVLYRLTDNPDARQALSESVEAFYPATPPTERPTSRHYLLAHQLLDLAHSADESEREQLLAEAEHGIEMAEQAEGGAMAPDRIRAYLQYERARMAYLRGQWKEAGRSFEALRELFARSQSEAMVRQIDEYRLCVRAWERYGAAMPASAGKAALARIFLETLEDTDYRSDSPLFTLSLQLLREVPQLQWAHQYSLDDRESVAEDTGADHIIALTSRQAEILQSLAEGRTDEEIARQLGIALGTVRKHKDDIIAHIGAYRINVPALISLRQAHEKTKTVK